MSESKANQCEFHLIKAWMPVSKPYLKASVDSISDMAVDGLPVKYSTGGISRLDAGQYIAYAFDHKDSSSYAYRIMAKSRKCSRVKSQNVITDFIAKKNIVLAIDYIDRTTAIIVNNQKKAEIKITRKITLYKNGWKISNRFIQHRGDDIYYIDDGHNLSTVKWSDIEAGIYTGIRVVDTDVVDFSMSKDGVGVLHGDGKVTLSSGKSFDLEAVKRQSYMD